MTISRILSLLTACAIAGNAFGADKTSADKSSEDKATQVMKASFKERGQAKLDRLDSDETMTLCNKYAGGKLPNEVAREFARSARAQPSRGSSRA